MTNINFWFNINLYDTLGCPTPSNDAIVTTGIFATFSETLHLSHDYTLRGWGADPRHARRRDVYFFHAKKQSEELV